MQAMLFMLAIIFSKNQFSSFSFICFVLKEGGFIFLITLTPGNASQSQIHNLFKLYSIKKRKEKASKQAWHERRHLSNPAGGGGVTVTVAAAAVIALLNSVAVQLERYTSPI